MSAAAGPVRLRPWPSTSPNRPEAEDLVDDELTDLRGLDGTPFDLTFLDRMISHHRAAVADAQEVLDGGEHPDVRALAERVIAEHEDRVAQMEQWRDEWEGEDELG